MLFREIVELFLEDAPALLVQAHRSLANGDATTLERAAHSLKGLAANLDALTVVSAAHSIEQHAQERDLSLAGACLPELSKRLQGLAICADQVPGRGRREVTSTSIAPETIFLAQ